VNKIKFYKGEKELLSQVPPDYYQKGIRTNFLQRLWHRGKLNAVLSMIENNPTNVLDVGCASGWFLSNLKKKYPNSKCVGVDKYKDAIVYGNKKYKNLKLVYADAHKLPFKSKTFDLVICTEVLEHVEDPKTVVREIERVLVKKGSAVVEMDSGNILFRAAWYWWTNIRRGVWRDSHIHAFNSTKLEKLLKSSKLNIEEKKTFNFTMGVAFLLKKE
jgi:ubiquinone/menaquinone biosynthesis C-methylase UbiE